MDLRHLSSAAMIPGLGLKVSGRMGDSGCKIPMAIDTPYIKKVRRTGAIGTNRTRTVTMGARVRVIPENRGLGMCNRGRREASPARLSARGTDCQTVRMDGGGVDGHRGSRWGGGRGDAGEAGRAVMIAPCSVKA